MTPIDYEYASYSMKRSHRFSRDDVLVMLQNSDASDTDAVESDDEPIMLGSDDEFSDLEMDIDPPTVEGKYSVYGRTRGH